MKKVICGSLLIAAVACSSPETDSADGAWCWANEPVIDVFDGEERYLGGAGRGAAGGSDRPGTVVRHRTR